MNKIVRIFTVWSETELSALSQAIRVLVDTELYFIEQILTTAISDQGSSQVLSLHQDTLLWSMWWEEQVSSRLLIKPLNDFRAMRNYCFGGTIRGHTEPFYSFCLYNLNLLPYSSFLHSDMESTSSSSKRLPSFQMSVSYRSICAFGIDAEGRGYKD